MEPLSELDYKLCQSGCVRDPAACERQVCGSVRVLLGAGVLELRAPERGECSGRAGGHRGGEGSAIKPGKVIYTTEAPAGPSGGCSNPLHSQ